MPDIVTFSATSRPGNYTSHALALVEDELTTGAHRVTSFDARELSLAFPGQEPTEDATKIREAVKAAAAVVIATPEYHGGFSAMAKLIIENLGFPSALSGKPVALVGVAAGRIGAIKALEQLRSVCAHTGAIVLPGAVSVAGVQNAFDEDGTCTDPGTEKALRRLAGSLSEFIREYVCPKYVLEEMIRDGGKAWTTNI